MMRLISLAVMLAVLLITDGAMAASTRPSCDVSPDPVWVLQQYTVTAHNLPANSLVDLEQYVNYLGGEKYYGPTITDIPTDASGTATWSDVPSLTGTITFEWTDTPNTVDYASCNVRVK